MTLDKSSSQNLDRQPPHTFRLGEWLIDPQLHQATGTKSTVQITHKCMQILLLLVKAPKRVMSRADLLNAAWPDTVVNEESLTRAICDLRGALGDDPAKASYIKTIHKGGYQLIAPVEYIDQAAEPAPVVKTSPKTEDTAGIKADKAGDNPDDTVRKPESIHIIQQRRWAILMPIGLAMVLLMVWAVIGAKKPDPNDTQSVPARDVDGIPLTSSPGHETNAAFSFDGTRVAYARRGLDNQGYHIFIKQPSETNELQITSGPTNDLYPTWSPDGRAIAFIRNQDNAIQICQVPSLGGKVRILYEQDGYANGLDWSPQGETLVFAAAGLATQFRLYELNINTGKKGELAVPPAGSAGDVGPVYSPDGNRIAFERRGPSGHESVYILSLSGDEEPGLVTAELRRVGRLDWLPGGRDLVVAASPRNRIGLWRVEIETGLCKSLVLPWSEIVDPAVSPVDGSLIIQARNLVRNIVRLNIPEDHSKSDPLPFDLIFQSTRDEFLPSIDPDGQRVAFCSDRNGSVQVFLADQDGSGQREISSFDDLQITSLAWAPDGSALLFNASDADGNSWLGLLDPSRGEWNQLDTGGHEIRHPIWSNDGQTIYFNMFKDGVWRLWEMTVETADLALVYPDYAFASHTCSASGDFYFFKVGIPGFYRLDDNGEEVVVEGFPYTNDVTAYTSHGDQLFCSVTGQQGSLLVTYNTVTTVCDTLGIIPQSSDGRLTISPDGRVIMTSIITQLDSDLILLPRFLEVEAL